MKENEKIGLLVPWVGTMIMFSRYSDGEIAIVILSILLIAIGSLMFLATENKD